jgi:hypothetical protein
MTWRVAKSLSVLLSEANAVAPNRSKTYDGTIGDAAHAARASRHNPNSAGVVTALDITHDPKHGMDTYALFDYLRAHPHKDLAYVISNRRFAARTSNWEVRPYTGVSPHDCHIHVAVGVGSDSDPRMPYDDTDSWGLQEWKGDQMPIDTVSDPLAKAAVDKLVAAGIITKPEAHIWTDAASVGLLWVVIARLLEKIK